MSRAQDLIGVLRSQGVSQASIGRALGRDPSMISQVARGVVEGARYVDALDALAAGRPASPPAHRLGLSVPDTVAVIQTRRGPAIIAETRAVQGVRPAIANAARRTRDDRHVDGRGRVALTVEGLDASGRPSTVTLFGRGGIRGDHLQQMINDALRDRGVDPYRAEPWEIEQAIQDVADDHDGSGDGTSDRGGAIGSIHSVSVQAV